MGSFLCAVSFSPPSFPSVFMLYTAVYEYLSRLHLVLVHTRKGSWILANMSVSDRVTLGYWLCTSLPTFNKCWSSGIQFSDGSLLCSPWKSAPSPSLKWKLLQACFLFLSAFPLWRKPLPPLKRYTHFACVGVLSLPIRTLLHLVMNECLYKKATEIWFSAFWWTKTYMKMNTKDQHKTGWLIKSFPLLAIIYCLVSGKLYIYANLSASGSILDSRTKWIKVVCFANECKWLCLWGAL